MSEDKSFVVKVLAELSKTKSLMRLKADLKSIESKLSKLKIQGKLDTASVKKDINSKIKAMKPKIKIDADMTQATKKIKKLGRQKINTKVNVDTTQAAKKIKKLEEKKIHMEVVAEDSKENSDSKESQDESKIKSFFKNISDDIIGTGISNITNAVYQAIQSVKELDAIKTNIQIVSGTSDTEVNSIMKTYNDMAKELSSTTKSVSEAANEFLSMGETVASTNELIKSSQVLSKIGMIESAEAANHLMSIMEGYNITAQNSIDIVSKLTNVDLNASVGAGELAEAISQCAGVANDSGTSINRLIGYMTTVGETTQDSMSVVGDSFHSMYSRMNNIKMGKLVDDETGESLSNTEHVLNGLGIQLKDTQNIYRDFDDVLDDVGKNWKYFTQAQQDDISVAIAGATQKEHFIALMNNYSNALKYSEMAINSSGVAMERYGVYQDSLEAKCNELTAAIESLSTNVISEELYGGIIQATTGIIEFLDKTNLLKTALAGLTIRGISKLFVAMGTGIAAAAKNTAQFMNTMALFNNQKTTNNLLAIGAASKELKDNQLKWILSAKGLKNNDRLAILEGKGVEEAKRQETLTKLGFPEKKAADSTRGFSGTIKNLGASIKGLAAAHPAITAVVGAVAAIGVVSTVVTGIIKATTTSVDDLRKQSEKAREEAQNAANDLQSTKSELDQVKSKIQELENKDGITIVEENELAKLRIANDELQRQLDLKTKIYNKKQKESAKATADYLESDKAFRNGESGDSIDAANWKLEAIKEHQAELEELQQMRIQTENEILAEGFGPDEFQDSFVWGDINEKIKAKKDTIDNLDEQYSSQIQELQEKKPELYDSDGEILKEYEDLGKQIDGAISNWSVYSNAQDYKSQIINNLMGKGVSENDIDSILASLSEEEIKQAATLDIAAYIDKNVTVDKIKEAIELAQEKADEQAIQVKLQVQELDPSDFLKSSQDKTKPATLVDLQEEADLLSSLSDELSKTGKIGTASMQSIIEKYPEAKEYLGDYMLGVVSEAELFAKLQEVYTQDAQSYKVSLLNKAESDGTFYQTLVANNQELFTELSNVYKQDFSNYKNLAQAKAELDKQLAQKLTSFWAQYYELDQNPNTGLYEIKTKGEELTAEEQMALAHYQTMSGDLEVDNLKELEKIKDHLNRVQKIAFDQIDINLDTSWEGLSGFDSSSFDSASGLEQNTSKDYDLIERAIQKLEREISNLDTIIGNTYDTWSTRNSALLSQIDKINEEINTQQAAYQHYMDLADGVGLDSYYQDLIKNGDIDIITIEDKELQDQIDTFQNFYDKALSAQDSVSKLQSQLNELDKTKFDNIIKQFESIEDGISHTVNMIDKRLKLIEEKGFFANSSIYEKLIEQHKAQLQVLNDKRNKLTDVLHGSDIQEGTQAWDELKQQINNVNEAILDTIISIEQFNNELNTNEFAKFDYFQDKISSLTEESDFYTSLIESMGKKLVDENGSYTSEGWTTAGLHAQNFNTYLRQAEEYANMIDKINKQLADDSNNTVLLEQKQEYIKAQRDSILSAQDEREAIINLIKDGYDKQLDSLGKVIDKYKDLLSSIKEANDYEKNIREQTENLANLNKQYLAVLGDDSEGNRKNIQQLENDIKEAQEELQETQYEKLISDTEKLLDDLQADYEELMNQRLDNIDNELINIYSGINENANSIKDTLSQLSTDSNMLLSEEIKDIWNHSQPIIDLNSSVDTVNESISGTNTAIDNLRFAVEAILNKMDMIINEQIGQNEIIDSDNTTTSTTESSDTTGNYNINDSLDSSSNTRSFDWWIDKKDYYPKDELNIETSIVDRLKWHDYDSSKEARAIYYEMMGLGSSDEYYGSDKQNVAMLSWMKEKGYADGSRYIAKRQIAFTQEKGSEMIYDKSTGSMLTPVSMAQFIRSLQQKSGMLTYLETGDKVFTNGMSENLWKIARNPYDFGVDIKPDFNYDIPAIVSGNANNHVKIDFGDVHVTLPNVKNYQEFMQQAQADKNFAKMVESIALGKAFGANTFDKCTFR